MNAKECLEGSEPLLSVHIAKCMNWWKSLGAMLLFPFKDAEAHVSLVLWHLYVFKDMQSPSFRELFSAQQVVSKSQNMWTCGCSPVPGRQGIFPQSSVSQLIMFLPLTEALGHFTKRFSTPDNHTILLAMQIIQYRASFLKNLFSRKCYFKTWFCAMKKKCLSLAISF